MPRIARPIRDDFRVRCTPVFSCTGVQGYMSLAECPDDVGFVPSAGKQKVAYCIEPLKDRRWDEFVQWHPQSSIFHSSAWLSSLSRTYGYQPIAYTTCPKDEELKDAVVFCRVESWLTGRRLISLPFSDHCEPLVDTEEDLEALSALLGQEVRREKWRYMELRPLGRFD